MANEAFPLLPAKAITTALTNDLGTVRDLGRAGLAATGLIAQATFAWGSGGTAAKVWIETSLDNGATWIGIINFAFTTAIASKGSAVSTVIAPTAQGFDTTAVLADNTVLQGVLGDRLRTRLTTTGTYAATTLAVWVTLRGGRG